MFCYKNKFTFCSVFVLVLMYGVIESRADEDEDSCPGIYSCANCTAVRLCQPNPSGSGFLDYKTVNCTGVTPYCDPSTGTCVSTPTTECATPNEFVCLKDGTFPNPTDCTRYYYCSNLESYSVKCSQSYYYYDSNSESCIYNRGCYRFNCNGNNGFKVTYPNDPSIYTYCISSTATLVDRCYGKDELNITSQKCEPVCRNEGLIPDTKDCKRYYRCNSYQSKTNYAISSLKCPDGQAFHKYEFQCLPISRVPDCKNASSVTNE